ncbi:uncharacterized protein LOC116347804 isoform X2 [Contarinia nasturtii]|uniref:uncharacterized protein LOC116347804 isoform X2 n=1 Tax=Contarinia nasturtii TaxID=265458 RepID=UPI0012D43142|nr:uncharacterized protein LOC116347804 isoform X2 [Contarinia nasturtii]
MIGNWRQILSNYWTNTQVATEKTLQLVKDDFECSGMVFDDKFKEYFLRTTNAQVVQVYEGFILEVQFNPEPTNKKTTTDASGETEINQSHNCQQTDPIAPTTNQEVNTALNWPSSKPFYGVSNNETICQPFVSQLNESQATIMSGIERNENGISIDNPIETSNEEEDMLVINVDGPNKLIDYDYNVTIENAIASPKTVSNQANREEVKRVEMNQRKRKIADASTSNDNSKKKRKNELRSTVKTAPESTSESAVIDVTSKETKSSKRSNQQNEINSADAEQQNGSTSNRNEHQSTPNTTPLHEFPDDDTLEGFASFVGIINNIDLNKVPASLGVTLGNESQATLANGVGIRNNTVINGIANGMMESVQPNNTTIVDLSIDNTEACAEKESSQSNSSSSTIRRWNYHIVEDYLFKNGITSRRNATYELVANKFPGLQRDEFNKLATRAKRMIENDSVKRPVRRPRKHPKIYTDSDTNRQFLNVSGSDDSDGESNPDGTYDQSFANIVANDPCRVRNFIVRNGLYYSQSQVLNDHIRRHYRITAMDRTFVDCAMLQASRYIDNQKRKLMNNPEANLRQNLSNAATAATPSGTQTVTAQTPSGSEIPVRSPTGSPSTSKN